MPELDWDSLGFHYMKTAGNIRYTWKDGCWNEGQIFTEDTMPLSIAACALHYGQSCFEGLKAFRNEAGEIKIFRPDANARRLNSSLHYLLCPEIPEAMFLDAVRRVVEFNRDYVPPMSSRGSLYIRPVVFASNGQVGVGPGSTYEFIIFVVPVGAYYKNGMESVDALILDDYDRAAPKGTGHIKAAGNYAAGLYAGKAAKQAGYPIALFLDPATRTKIEEFSTSNFIAVTKDGHYITPSSHSVLPSITNDSLQQLARHLGIPVECRDINETELSDLAEVAACGTAVVITPVRSIVHGNKTYCYGESCGPVLRKLYDAYRAIQYGKAPDVFNWLMDV